ncbi:MAG: ATP-binding protein [Deltaproteobacteria bacterium]|nr:MAG: ATP-binding protein [Deltaproteobacteria bacterium]
MKYQICGGKFDFEWNLHPDVNILAGINGSGKSTMLDCICALLSVGALPKEISFLESLRITFDNQKYISYEHIEVKDTIRNIEKKAQKDDKYRRVLSEISEIKNDAGNDYRKITSVRFEMGIASFDDINMTLHELHELINIDVISTFDNALRQSEAVRKLSDENVKTELDWNIEKLQKRYLDYQLNISKKKDVIIENSENIKEYLALLKKPHSLFMNIIDTLFGETGKKLDRDKNEISFLSDKNEITPFQLSSGEKQLLIILLTVLLQDNNQSILFMDEPEISLHIEWQKKLIGFIRDLNPNVQVILATHSPGIIMDGWLDKVSEIRDIVIDKNSEK